MDQDATPDGAGAHAQGAEHDTGHHRAQHLGQGLVVVDHAVRHGHAEDGVRAHAALEGVEHVAAEEDLQRPELQGVEHLPGEVVGPGAAGQLVEGVGMLERRCVRHHHHRRQHDEEEQHIDPGVLQGALDGEAVVADALARHEEDRQPGQGHIAEQAEARPVGEG